MTVHAQDDQYLGIIRPVAIVDNASWTTEEIDTAPLGVPYNYCTIIFSLGATDIAMAALKVQEASASGGSFADITGLVFGTSTNTDGDTSSLPSATDDDLLFVFHVDLRGRKRFLDLVATGGDGSAGAFGCAIAILSRASQMPDTATKRGASQILRI